MFFEPRAFVAVNSFFSFFFFLGNKIFFEEKKQVEKNFQNDR